MRVELHERVGQNEKNELITMREIHLCPQDQREEEYLEIFKAQAAAQWVASAPIDGKKAVLWTASKLGTRG